MKKQLTNSENKEDRVLKNQLEKYEPIILYLKNILDPKNKSPLWFPFKTDCLLGAAKNEWEPLTDYLKRQP